MWAKEKSKKSKNRSKYIHFRLLPKILTELISNRNAESSQTSYIITNISYMGSSYASLLVFI